MSYRVPHLQQASHNHKHSYKDSKEPIQAHEGEEDDPIEAGINRTPGTHRVIIGQLGQVVWVHALPFSNGRSVTQPFHTVPMIKLSAFEGVTGDPLKGDMATLGMQQTWT